MIGRAASVVSFLLLTTSASASVRQIAVNVEPPQEPAAELGVLHGRIESADQKNDGTFVWLSQRADAKDVVERELILEADHSFRLMMPAGTYAGAILGIRSATRIRSGIVVKPGQTTDIGVLRTEGTIPVSVRVLDAATAKPVAAARVVWDPPPDILNSPIIERLYARRWTTTTDKNGIAEMASVGPIPHSVRWRIETKEYAPAHTARTQLRQLRRTALPDVRLRHMPTAIVRVEFPRRHEETLANCTLVAGEIRDPHSPVFVPVSRVPLREGESRSSFATYGPKRLWIENKAGKTIFYSNFDTVDETTFVDLSLRPVEIHGRVTQRDEPVADSLVTLADPHNAKVILAQNATDDSGQYRFTTWQSGEIFLYTIGRRGDGAGKRFGTASSKVDVTGKTDVEVNLELPSAGYSIAVVDEKTGAPVRASIDSRIQYNDGGGSMGRMKTDDAGRIDVSSFPPGKARLHVEANGYRAADIEIAITDEMPATTIRLERAGPMTGRIVNAQGHPIPGALLLGGFPDVDDVESFYRATTDAAGEFRLEIAPPPATIFYVVAAGYALGMTTLDPDRPTTVVLHPPSTSIVTLREDNRSPEKVYLVMAAPSGRDFIPIAVMEELAQAGGMSLYQLCGSSVDGDVILPEFLPPGSYDLSIARRGGRSFIFQRIGTISVPMQRNAVLTFRSP